jgi:hypothetical protein
MERTPSPLLDVLNACTAAWVQRYSLISIPPLRPRPSVSVADHQRNRDLFIVAMLGLSLAALASCYPHDLTVAAPPWLRATAAFAFYRCADIFITLVRTGVFFSFRGDVRINQEPLWRVQRVLVGVMSNYIELVAWFAILYFQLAATSPCQFTMPIRFIHQAVNLSFTTMTTIGYGVYSPNALLSTVLTFWQALAGVTLLAIVVGVIIALLIAAKSDAEANAPAERLSWARPLITFVIVYALLYWLVGAPYCWPRT